MITKKKTKMEERQGITRTGTIPTRIEDLPLVQVDRTERKPYMAGKGVMHLSENCLVLNPSTKKYQALFLTCLRSHINCFGLTDTEFEHLFTQNLQELFQDQNIDFGSFLTNTVNHESEVLIHLFNQNGVFGLKIDLSNKSMSFEKKQFWGRRISRVSKRSKI